MGHYSYIPNSCNPECSINSLALCTGTLLILHGKYVAKDNLLTIDESLTGQPDFYLLSLKDHSASSPTTRKSQASGDCAVSAFPLARMDCFSFQQQVLISRKLRRHLPVAPQHPSPLLSEGNTKPLLLSFASSRIREVLTHSMGPQSSNSFRAGASFRNTKLGSGGQDLSLHRAPKPTRG